MIGSATGPAVAAVIRLEYIRARRARRSREGGKRMTFQGDGCPPVEPPKRGWVRRKALTIALPTGVALGAGAVIASGAIPAADGTIGAYFVPQSTVRFVDAATDCRPGESFVAFNQQGPQGQQGAAGAP